MQAIAAKVRATNVRRIEALERLWERFDSLSSVRDPLATLLHPIYFGQGEDIESRVRAAHFVRSLPRSVKRFASPFVMRDWTVAQANPEGLFLEFGVAGGQSVNQIAARIRRLNVTARLYGFDSFAGLHEDWREGIRAGEFAQEALPIVGENVVLIMGLFERTLESFLAGHPQAVSFVHVDSDLYSSCKFVLATLLEQDRLRAGSVILFDELFNYPGWFHGGEYRALGELLPDRGLWYEFLAIAPLFQQVAIRLRRRE
jgi:hypothetical protein